MGRALALLYGTVCYFIFFGIFLYAIWFVWTMDRPQEGGPLTNALLINTGLLLLFAIQHSGMARQGFKRVWTKIIPQPVERSTYVLATCVALLALIIFWQPMTTVIWEVEAPAAQMVLHVLFGLGWLTVLVSTFLIDHFELFGFKQVWRHWKNQTVEAPAFKTPGLYRFVRHPIYLGFLVAFWSAPLMTLGHLYFAGVITAWVLLAIQLEERDLVRIHGEDYKVYRSGVSMLVPWPSKRKTP